MSSTMSESSSLSTTSGDFSSSRFTMTGTRLAHFVNGYSPLQDKPLTHLELNSDVYVDEQLGQRLADDRRRNVQHHLVADRDFRDFVDSRLHNASMMRR